MQYQAQVQVQPCLLGTCPPTFQFSPTQKYGTYRIVEKILMHTYFERNVRTKCSDSHTVYYWNIVFVWQRISGLVIIELDSQLTCSIPGLSGFSRGLVSTCSGTSLQPTRGMSSQWLRTARARCSSVCFLRPVRKFPNYATVKFFFLLFVCLTWDIRTMVHI